MGARVGGKGKHQKTVNLQSPAKGGDSEGTEKKPDKYKSRQLSGIYFCRMSWEKGRGSEGGEGMKSVYEDTNEGDGGEGMIRAHKLATLQTRTQNLREWGT